MRTGYDGLVDHFDNVFREGVTPGGPAMKTWTFHPEPVKPLRWWCDRFQSRFGGQFADAYLRLGPVSFHLSRTPSEGWAYRVNWRGFDVTVRW